MSASAAPAALARSAARLAALQALYQLEMTGADPGEVTEEFIKHRFHEGVHDETFFTDVVRGVVKHRSEERRVGKECRL